MKRAFLISRMEAGSKLPRSGFEGLGAELD